jgi:hypothetical protein
LGVTTTAAAAIAAAVATTIAAAVAATVATAVATTVATVTTVASAMATVTAVAAIAAIAPTAATTKGQSLAVTAHEGNTNQREKQRETENNDSIHPQILQLLTGTGKWDTLFRLPSTAITRRLPTAQCRDATFPSESSNPSGPKRSLLSISTGCEGYDDRED